MVYMVDIAGRGGVGAHPAGVVSTIVAGVGKRYIGPSVDTGADESGDNGRDGIGNRSRGEYPTVAGDQYRHQPEVFTQGGGAIPERRRGLGGGCRG